MSRIIEDFENICEEKKKSIAFIYHGKRGLVKKSFSDLYADVARSVKELRIRKVKKGARILVFTPPSYELAVFMLACMKLGISVMYVDIWAGRKLVSDTLKKYKADHIAVSKKTSFLRLGSASIRKIKDLIFIDKEYDNCPFDRSDKEYEDIEEDHPALLTMTSGSTGQPKIALRTHADLYEQLELVNSNMGEEESQVVLTTAFIYSFANILKGFCTVLSKVNLSLPFDFLLNKKLELFKDVPITTIMTSPDFCLRTKNYYQNLKTLYVGGAILNIHEAKIIKDKFNNADVEYIYGATECNLISKTRLEVYINDLQNKKIACLGSKVVGVDIKSNDKYEIMVSSKAILKEYIEAERKNICIDEDGVFWHKTGDAGRYVSDKLYYLGRCDVYAVKNNKKVHTNPIEQSIAIDFDMIKKCAFFYHKGKNRLYIESKKPVDLTSIKGYLSEKGFDNVDIHLLNKIPCDKKHHTKIDYKRLRSMSYSHRRFL